MKPLIEIMEKELNLLDKLSEIMKQKQYSLIAFSVDEMNSILNQEIQLVAQVKSCDRKRIEIIKQLLPEVGNPEEIKVSDLLKICDERNAKQILFLKGNLLRSLEKVKNINDTNKALVQRSKRFVKDIVSVFTENGEKQLVDKKV